MLKTITLTLFSAALVAACSPARDDGDVDAVDASVAVADAAVADAAPSACEVDTDCAPVCDAFGQCGGFEDTCQQNGLQSRECDDMACVEGACVAKGRITETVVCMRDTDGVECAQAETSCGACGQFTSACDEIGLLSCTETTFACAAGACAPTATAFEDSCTRSTEGDSCGIASTVCGACQYESACDESGTRSCTTSTPICTGGGCEQVVSSSTQSCSRDTDGQVCDTVVCGGGIGFGTRDLCCAAEKCSDICSPCTSL